MVAHHQHYVVYFNTSTCVVTGVLDTGYIYTHNFLTTFWSVVLQCISLFISIHYYNHPLCRWWLHWETEVWPCTVDTSLANENVGFPTFCFPAFFFYDKHIS